MTCSVWLCLFSMVGCERETVSTTIPPATPTDPPATPTDHPFTPTGPEQSVAETIEELNAKTPDGSVPVIAADTEDPRLVAATADARANWPVFVSVWQERDGDEHFAVKVGLKTSGDDIEYIWLTVDGIDASAGVIDGKLGNEPVGDIGYKLGDPVQVPSSEVLDWIIVEPDGAISGGFSIPALLEIEKERQNEP